MTYDSLKKWIRDYIDHRARTYGASDFLQFVFLEIIQQIYKIFKLHFGEEKFADRLKGWDDEVYIYSAYGKCVWSCPGF